jgi:AraC-like DNA-binding protein
MSKYYFIKLFKSATGATPQQYYMAMLMDKSKLLLSNTSHTVGEIATQCGIEDALYFSRLFKKHVGCSPSAYRSKNL